MTSFHSSFLKTSEQRGFLHQVTHANELDALLAEKSVVAYLGFDVTASSLHVGNLVGIMWLRRLQTCGHKPIVLLGNATTKIGDPSGKDTVRKCLDDKEIESNISRIAQTFERYLRFDESPTSAEIVFNGDWLLPLNYVDFLSHYGRHFTINRMMSFDSVRLRLEREQPLTFLEFNYMIFQAYDFLHLFRTKGCQLQLGGGDQWGNIINGVELIRRVEHKEAYGLTAPLITTASGVKMGKSVDGAVWLNGDMLSPYDYWQFWRNTDDRDVGRYLRLFTDLEIGVIEQLELLEDSEINKAKKILADEATALAHGIGCLPSIHQTVQAWFEGGEIGGESIVLSRADVPPFWDDLFLQLRLVESKGAFKRLVAGNGIRIDDRVLCDPKEQIPVFETVKLSVGRKKHCQITVF